MKLTVIRGAIDPNIVRMILPASANDDDGKTVIETTDPRVGIALLIDTVAVNPLVPLPLLLDALCQSDQRKLTQEVLRLAVICRDPLSKFRTICVDALNTEATLEKLLNAPEHWTDLREAAGSADVHACALSNLCEHKVGTLRGKKRQPYAAMYAKISAAAARERLAETDRIKAYGALRTVLHPDLWELLEQHAAQAEAK